MPVDEVKNLIFLGLASPPWRKTSNSEQGYLGIWEAEGQPCHHKIPENEDIYQLLIIKIVIYGSESWTLKKQNDTNLMSSTRGTSKFDGTRRLILGVTIMKEVKNGSIRLRLNPYLRLFFATHLTWGIVATPYIFFTNNLIHYSLFWIVLSLQCIDLPRGPDGLLQQL